MACFKGGLLPQLDNLLQRKSEGENSLPQRHNPEKKDWVLVFKDSMAPDRGEIDSS